MTDQPVMTTDPDLELRAALAAAAPDPVLVLGEDRRCVLTNPAADAFLTTGAWERALLPLLARGRRRAGEVNVSTRSGRRLFEARLRPVTNGRVAVFLRDIGPLRELEVRVRERDQRDALTGLLDHGGFHEHLARVLATESGESLALVVADVDFLKNLNDTHGHRAGDAALRSVAHALRGVVRAEDELARLGGDEFAWLVRGAERQEVVRAARRAVTAVAATSVAGDRRLTLSVGVAFDPSTPEPGDLLDRADLALYRAKAGGRGVVVVADDTELEYESRRPPGATATGPPPDLTAAGDLDTAARAALREWVHVFAVSGGCIDLLDPTGQVLRARAYYRFGHDDWELATMPYALADYPSTAGALAQRTTYTCRVDDPDADPAETALLSERGFAALLLTPLVARGRPLGTIELFDTRHRTFTAAEQRVALGFASHLSAVLAPLVEPG